MKVYNENTLEPMHEELQNILRNLREQKGFSAEKYTHGKANLLNKYMNKFGLKSCVIAVSGGIDSAIVLGIVKKAEIQENSPIKRIVPLLLPVMKSVGATNQASATERGKELCEKLELSPFVVDITAINNQIRQDLESVIGIKGQDWAIGQLCSYSRTPIIYYTTSLLCQEGYPSIVCGTTNKDEGTYLGYVGKASDGMVDVQLISDIHKSEVYAVGEYLDIPKSIMTATPTGDMYDNRTDEMVFGSPYDFVEVFLNYLNWVESKQKEIISNLSLEAKEQFDFYANNLENLHRYNAHKYMSKSPAIHLDLWDSSTIGGWDNYYEITRNLLKGD